MPQSAITAGYATNILPVEEMPSMLLKLTRQSAFPQQVPLTPRARPSVD
jgi:chemotaxis response regulator CheB